MVKLSVVDGLQKGEILFGCDFKNPQVVFQHLLGNGSEWRMNLSRATYAEKMVWGAYDAISRCTRALRNERVVRIEEKTFVLSGGRKFSAVINEIAEMLCTFSWLKICDDRSGDLVIKSAAGPVGWN